MNYPIQHTGIVILAAGQSKRLGQPKQLLTLGEKTLLQHTIDSALKLKFPVFVVLGANEKNIRQSIQHENIHIIINDEWEEGMASSIRKGISALKQLYMQTDGIIILVCDQPFIETSVLEILINEQKNNDVKAIACSYSNKLGTPALFHKSLFSELMELKGDIGARQILKKHKEEIASIEFKNGKWDIDTLEDFMEILKIHKQI